MESLEVEREEFDEAQKRLVMKVYCTPDTLRRITCSGCARSPARVGPRSNSSNGSSAATRATTRQTPRQSRKVAFAKTFRFNVIVGVNLFYLTYQVQEMIMLNIIDHNTKYQAAARCKSKDAREISRQIAKVWMQVFGAPQVLLSDIGTPGRSFAGRGRSGSSSGPFDVWRRTPKPRGRTASARDTTDG